MPHKGITISRAEIPDRIASLFWSRVAVNREQPDTCWDWTGALDGRGYGKIAFGGKVRTTSRVAYALANGVTPGDAVICHSCDNPACCNPKHLEAGDQSKNIKDAFKRGRVTPRVGSANENAKLTDEQVAELRRRVLVGGEITAHIAPEYGISQSVASGIVRGKRYRNVPMPTTDAELSEAAHL